MPMATLIYTDKSHRPPVCIHPWEMGVLLRMYKHDWFFQIFLKSIFSNFLEDGGNLEF